MGMRVCSEPGCPELQAESRCANHRRENNKRAGTTSERGYGTEHKAERRQWEPHVAAGKVKCWRCKQRISPLERWELGHFDDRSGYGGPEHVRCNRATAGRTPTEVTLVTGPPASGKTTYVQTHAQPGDLVVDLDAIAQALGSPDTHDHPEQLKPFIFEARDAVIERIGRDASVARAWLIAVNPTDRDLALATDVVTLDVDAETCKARAQEAGRPARWLDLIDQWHTRHGG